VPSAERIAEYVHQAFRHALTGRQGPVHLTIQSTIRNTLSIRM